ncbi:unnamed protein product [marine sediment metagenome]|uniref:Uncharacterized protein n=1 Tax=marine sediment metagenome TaxID=412755 RepID=X0UZN0_9ZZZZ
MDTPKVKESETTHERDRGKSMRRAGSLQVADDPKTMLPLLVAQRKQRSLPIEEARLRVNYPPEVK